MVFSGFMRLSVSVGLQALGEKEVGSGNDRRRK